jgi:nucleoside-diphosphate-sugar epimerase/SAM-dependent methyltransferase
MEKIVITGGLGYLGTELCNLYSGESRFKEVIVYDKNFKSASVAQLRKWSIKFIQGDILDKELLSSVLQDADVVFHLAGITDVAYTTEEELGNPEKSDEIANVGIKGSRNVIEAIPKTCKLIFPSTHVVYEGFSEKIENITEDEPTNPYLKYATGKNQTEIDLQKSSVNYIVCRLASVYGYSGDSTRIGIMPNLFSKIASQNGTIKLFSGGVQLKTLVPIADVVRCFKFMAENQEISRETFHVAKDIVTVKEVAEICKRINPKLNVIETDDPIPNLGYSISNAKLLNTGFEFGVELEESLHEMITKWSEHQRPNDWEWLTPNGDDFKDERGLITNYVLEEPINWIGYIESTAGTIRANHYHPVMEQKTILMSGKYISVLQDLADPESPVTTKIIYPGDLCNIHPNIIHTMVFLEDSIFLNLVRGDRKHDNYGEKYDLSKAIYHTVRHTLVDDDFGQNLIENYSTKCRATGSDKIKPVLSLGLSPLANNLLKNIDDEAELFPLEMTYCPDSHNCQLSFVVPPAKLFDHYLYVSSTAESFRNHFKEAAEKYIEVYKLDKNSLVVDIGSNDGVFLKPLSENGIKVLGVEPAKNIAEISESHGIPTLNEYFDDEVADQILDTYGPADLVTASNVFAHADNLKEIADCVFKILKEDGTFIVEVQSMIDMLDNVIFDNIYHEHVNYWSATSINNFFSNLGYTIVKIERINTHGGSIRVYIENNPHKIDNSVDEILALETSKGLTDYKTYLDFGKKVETIKVKTLQNIKKLKLEGKTIVGFGAPAKATTVLNYFGISTQYIDYIVEDNELKQGLFVPGVNIPIKSKENIQKDPPDYIIVLAWNFFEDIKKNNQELTELGCKFITLQDLSEL